MASKKRPDLSKINKQRLKNASQEAFREVTGSRVRTSLNTEAKPQVRKIEGISKEAEHEIQEKHRSYKRFIAYGILFIISVGVIAGLIALGFYLTRDITDPTTDELVTINIDTDSDIATVIYYDPNDPTAGFEIIEAFPGTEFDASFVVTNKPEGDEPELPLAIRFTIYFYQDGQKIMDAFIPTFLDSENWLEVNNTYYSTAPLYVETPMSILQKITISTDEGNRIAGQTLTLYLSIEAVEIVENTIVNTFGNNLPEGWLESLISSEE